MNNIWLQIKRLFPLFLLAELASFLGYFYYSVDVAAFVFILLLGAYFGVRNFHYLVGLLLAELIIGSKGYLFYLALGNFHLSIRMALWVLVLVFWLWNLVLDFRRHRDTALVYQSLMPTSIKAFWPLMIFVVIAFANGLVRGNAIVNVYSDANAWLYFLLLWPLSYLVQRIKKVELDSLVAITVTAISWLTFKTWVILYFFSHDFPILDDMYHWIRDSGVGEITAMTGSFYRIFIQSHLYVLAALVVCWCVLYVRLQSRSLREFINDKSNLILLCLSSSLLSVILIGLSRSFWVGLIIVLLVMLISHLLDRRYSIGNKFRHAIRYVAALLATLMIALFIILVVIKVPFPRNTIEFNASSVLSERVTDADESAIGSRWALLPALTGAISQDWLLGQGFGASVTYLSSDPRVVAKTGGMYTTFAFEWGWLDLWLKLGLFGLLSYVYLLTRLWREMGGEQFLPLRMSLLALAGLHIFTPYLNHPLGIGLILMFYLVIQGQAKLLQNTQN